MARIQFADGTFTTREPHEVDTQTAIPENAQVVDHGPVVTTGLPDQHPKSALGIEYTIIEDQARHEVATPEDVEKIEESPSESPKLEDPPEVPHLFDRIQPREEEDDAEGRHAQRRSRSHHDDK